MNYHRGHLFGYLQLAPSVFIGVSALVTYALPHTEYKTRLTAGSVGG